MSQAFFELEIPVDGAVLHATAYPGTIGVVFACGSALADRDGNDQDVGFRPLAQLAEQLALQGMGSLRFDRRGVGQSSGDFAGPEITLQDFDQVLNLARQHFQHLVILSHAEGCGLGTLGALRHQVQGLILMAPPASSATALWGYGVAAEEALCLAPREHQPQALAVVQQNYRDRKPLFLFRPVLQVACPVLVIHGLMDWVFPPAESEQIAHELQKIGKPSTLVLLPGVDHWLIQTDHYRSLDQNLESHWHIDPEVALVLGRWLQENL